MNLYFRLLLIYLTSFFRKRVSPLGPVTSNFRVWPSDLDILGHMTNSRYFALMDAGRTELMMRSGLFERVKERGWYPLVVEEALHFRRALRPLVSFQLKTEITGYDERHFIVRQTFLKQGKVVALGLVRARFMGPNKAKISPAELLELVDVPAKPELTISQQEQQKHSYLKELIELENELLERLRS